MRSIPPRQLVLVTLFSLAVAVLAAVVYDRVVSDDDGPGAEVAIRLTPADREDNVAVPAGGPTDGEAVPATRMPRLGGGLGSLADYRGQPMVVNVFSTSCAPCIKEMPALEEVHQELGDRVAFVGLALNDSERQAQDLVDRTGVTYDILRDPAGKLWQELGGHVMPTTFLVSADGQVVGVHPGAATAETFRDRIRSELLT